MRRARRCSNRALHAHRIAAADPHRGELAPRHALATRVGYGTGEEVAEGRWTAARELPPRRASGVEREAALRPQERFAALLAARDVALACELLALRARLDLDQGRGREAALQLDAALGAALAELEGWRVLDGMPARIEELHELAPRAAAGGGRRPGGRARRGHRGGGRARARPPRGRAARAHRRRLALTHPAAAVPRTPAVAGGAIRRSSAAAAPDWSESCRIWTDVRSTIRRGDRWGLNRSLPQAARPSQEKLRMIRPPVSPPSCSPPPRSPRRPSPPPPRPAARAGKSNAGQAQDDHKPAGTGSGRKIG